MTVSTAPARTTRHIVADNLRAEIARKRLSGRQVANSLGLGQMYIARRLSGDVELSASDIIAFSDLLGIDPGVLFEGTKNAPTPKGGGKQLPELDSNQQPAGNKPNNVIEVDFTSYPSTELDTIATVTPLFA